MNLRKCMQKSYFFYLYFSIVHISTNNILINLKFREVVGDIHLEGSMSQNCILGLSCYFMLKKR